ncbi:hypothetical protein LXL04_039587 [Taraxacum kok-saghyz]
MISSSDVIQQFARQIHTKVMFVKAMNHVEFEDPKKVPPKGGRGVQGVRGWFGYIGPKLGWCSSNDDGDSSNRSSNPNMDKLFVDVKKPLFPGCDTFSVLGFILRLMHVKVTCKMTNACMDMTLSLLSEAFKDSIIPKTHYEAKKYLQTLGLGYESIHACKNNCALFWKENSELQSCPCCGASRWVVDTTNKKKIPVKVL